MTTTGTWYNPSHDRRITIDFDNDPEDPRENSNLATLWCEHPRLSLGDEFAEDAMLDLITTLAENQDVDFETTYLNCLECVASSREDWTYEVMNNDTKLNYGEWLDHRIDACKKCDEDGQVENPDYNQLDDPGEILRALQRVDPDEKYIFRLPLYFMNTSGFSMDTGGFSCSRDTRIVGIAFISKDTMVKEGCFGANKDTPHEELLSSAHTMIKAEVAEYDDFISGNAYCFKIEDLATDRMLREEQPSDFDDEPFMWEEIDACHGFLGDNAINHMLHNIEDIDAKWIKEAMK